MNACVFWGSVGIWLIAVSGCSSSLPVENNEALPGRKQEASPVVLSSFGVIYDQWKGTPYRLGGNSRRGIDCSAFVQVGYVSVFNLMLPRTTAEQAKMGKQISLSQAVEGDLVFFKTGRSVRHVGIYLGNAEFLHASTSRGVMISRLDNPYWQSTFWQVRRIRVL